MYCFRYDEDGIERRLVEYREELKIKAEEVARIKEPTPKSELFKSATYKPRYVTLCHFFLFDRA